MQDDLKNYADDDVELNAAILDGLIGLFSLGTLAAVGLAAWAVMS